MKYLELRKINVNEHTEKKGNLTYLSWAWAVDTLLQHDPMATWEYDEPKIFNETVMVYCSVSAFGKTIKMHLPVMDNRNNAIKNPDARKISDSQMRCLTKAIACFGIGLYLYAGEDLPYEEPPQMDNSLFEDAKKIIKSAPDEETLKDIYFSYAKAFEKFPEAILEIKKLATARKAELEQK
jgi:hypothetical protein